MLGVSTDEGGCDGTDTTGFPHSLFGLCDTCTNIQNNFFFPACRKMFSLLEARGSVKM